MHFYVCWRAVSCFWPALPLFSATHPAFSWAGPQTNPVLRLAASNYWVVCFGYILLGRVPLSTTTCLPQIACYWVLSPDSFRPLFSILDDACISIAKASHHDLIVLSFQARSYPDTALKINWSIWIWWVLVGYLIIFSFWVWMFA